MSPARPAPTIKVGPADYMTREEAMAVLDVKLQSFYTYVSRGLIRRHEVPGQKRKLYLKTDVERLAAKSHARNNTGAKAGETLRYGNPVVQTWICEITADGPRYRNRLAIDLASAGVSFEAVTELLWSGRFRAPRVVTRLEPLPECFFTWAAQTNQLTTAIHDRPVQMMSILLTALQACGAKEDDSSTGNTLQLAHQILQMFCGVAGYLGPNEAFNPYRGDETLAECIARGLGRAQDTEVVDAINAALVICAEHELAPPTFAARVCASTGADIYACVATGILAHMGPLQGGGTDGAEELLEEVLQPNGRVQLPRTNWSSRFDFPGFNHPLYTRDPRAVFLLERVKKLRKPHPDAKRILALVTDIESQMQFYPGITATMVILTRSLGLPKGSANLLFTISRTAGWIAHVMEQRMAGFMLRPRAQFVAGTQATPP